MGENFKNIVFGVKELAQLITIIVTILIAYFTGQANVEAQINNVKTDINKVKITVEVNKANINSINDDLTKIYKNQLKQDEKNSQLINLIYRHFDNDNK